MSLMNSLKYQLHKLFNKKYWSINNLSPRVFLYRENTREYAIVSIKWLFPRNDVTSKELSRSAIGR